MTGISEAVPRLTARYSSRMTLSSSENEAIVSVFDRVFALRGTQDSPSAVLLTADLLGHPLVQEEESRARKLRVPTDVEWTSRPAVWSDTPLSGATLYQEPEELAGLLATAEGHAYVFCATRPYAMFDGLLRPPGAAWITPVLHYGGSLVVGPTFSDDGWPCTQCWRRRMMDGTPSLRERVARRHTMMSSALEPDAALLLARTFWEAPDPAHSPFDVLDIDVNRALVSHEALLPVLECACGLDADPVSRKAQLSGRWVAPVRVSPPRPTGVAGTLAVDARSTAHVSIGGTSSDVDAARARVRAIAETIERGTAAASGRNRAGVVVEGAALPDAVRGFRPYSPQQYKLPGFAYGVVSDEARFLCVPATRLADGSQQVLPAQLCVLQRLPDETRLTARSSTGLAFAESGVQARERSLLELCERDQVTRHWFFGSAVEISDAYDGLPRRLQSGADRCFVRAAIITASTQVSPTAVVYVAPDADSPGALGSACEFTVAAAVDHAFRDAVIMYRHRAEYSALLSPAIWPALELADPTVWHLSGSAKALIEHYDPLTVDLTTAEAAAAGGTVTACWSACAVDFPRRGQPLPLGSAPELAALADVGEGLWAFSGVE